MGKLCPSLDPRETKGFEAMEVVDEVVRSLWKPTTWDGVNEVEVGPRKAKQGEGKDGGKDGGMVREEEQAEESCELPID